jgi:hypothetical protein
MIFSDHLFAAEYFPAFWKMRHFPGQDCQRVSQIAQNAASRFCADGQMSCVWIVIHEAGNGSQLATNSSKADWALRCGDGGPEKSGS